MPPPYQASCPDDGELAAFVERSLTSELRDAIEAHLDGCPTCREAIAHVAATSDAEPRRLGRYRLDRVLGSGGMGVVWQAWDPALERGLAIKLLRPEVTDDNGRARLVREARALARLQHPNVIAVYDVGELGADLFIATELIDGESMDRWQHGRPPAEVIAAYVQAARGVAAAHGIGLVHRDIKPSNILVGRDGRVRVGDFGLATRDSTVAVTLPGKGRGTTTAREPKLTVDGEVVGTPAYMAPEQREGDPVDARADQYSLCLALAEALLGVQPPTDATAASLAASGVEAPWPAIARGLAPRPSDRFPDLAALIDALDVGDPARPRARAPSRRLWWASGLVALTAIVGVATWQLGLFTSSPPPPPPPAPVVAPPPWMWTASTGGPWRLPIAGSGVAIIDPVHAVIVGLDDRVVVLDLATGVAGPPTAVVADGASIDGVVRTQDRVLAFGTIGSAPAAWEIRIEPLVATPLALADAGQGGPSDHHNLAYVAASPDGRRILVCMSERWPVVRDARTLAAIAVARGQPCEGAPWFTDEDHVVFGEPKRRRRFALTTGRFTAVRAGSPELHGGPGGRSLSVADSGDFVVTAPGGARITGPGFTSGQYVWTPDGAAVIESGFNALAIRRLASGPVVDVELPISASTLAVDARTAVMVDGYFVVAVDLVTGAVRGGDGNRGKFTAIAPRAGVVIVAADRLRTFTANGTVIASADPVREIVADPPDAPVLVVDTDVATWDPMTGARAVLRELERKARVQIDRHGEDVMYADGDGFYRGTATAGFTRQLEFADDLVLVGFDVATGRVAWTGKDAYHVVDLGRRTAWSFVVPSLWDSCGLGLGLRFLPGRAQLAIDLGSTIQLFDTDAHTQLAAISLPDLSVSEWDYVPATGELVLAGKAEVVVWNPQTGSVLKWEPPNRLTPSVLGIDAAGTQLAIGYEDGSLLWADLAELRAHASPREARLQPAGVPPSCASKVVPQRPFDRLVLPPAAP